MVAAALPRILDLMVDPVNRARDPKEEEHVSIGRNLHVVLVGDWTRPRFERASVSWPPL